MKIKIYATTLAMLLVSIAASAQPSSYKYVSINYPGSVTTNAFGINNYNSIVGAYQTTAGLVHGFKLNSGHFTRIDYPGAKTTVVQGISDTGDMVGWYTTAAQQYHGFYYHAGTFTSIDVPNAAHGTMAMGINKTGMVVGRWLDLAGNFHGFTWMHGVIHKVDLITGEETSLNGVSNLGVIAGQVTSQDAWRSLLKSGSDVDYLLPAGSADNEAYGVNGHGDVVGYSVASAKGYVAYQVEANEGSEATEKLPKLVYLAFPGALDTQAAGINYNRSIVGSFTDAHQHLQGFLAVPQ